jgi:hypothetical protein
MVVWSCGSPAVRKSYRKQTSRDKSVSYFYLPVVSSDGHPHGIDGQIVLILLNFVFVPLIDLNLHMRTVMEILDSRLWKIAADVIAELTSMMDSASKQLSLDQFMTLLFNL